MGRTAIPKSFLLRRCIFFSSDSPSGIPSSGVRCLQALLQAARLGGHRRYSSVAKDQKSDPLAWKWHELPPVPQNPRVGWPIAGEPNSWKNTLAEGPSDHGHEVIHPGSGVQTITAVRWVARCCPSLPSALVHKIFRLRQVRMGALQPNFKSDQVEDGPSIALDTERLRMRRVSGKTILDEGTVLYLPKSLFHGEEEKANLKQHRPQKTWHQSTASEVEWLQSLVLHKDAEILVINKPAGLPVQGGSEVIISLDSLMGTALKFDSEDGPRLVHRLDKETSGVMVLARTRESATLLHALLRHKTATAEEAEDAIPTIERCYWALVIGTPKQSQGRIKAPLIKVTLDEGRNDKIMVAHDVSSANAQIAITDYRVMGPASHGCTWLELHPLTGRKHQLRVHCAEVLGTPVLGDKRYGWRTHKEWVKKVNIQSSDTVERQKDTSSPSRGEAELKSSFGKTPALHLHSRWIRLPNVLQMVQQNKQGRNFNDLDRNWLQFVAPLPTHMAASGGPIDIT